MANLPTSIKNLNTLLGEQLAEGGGGGGAEPLIINYTFDPDTETYTYGDTTFGEVRQAFESGRPIISKNEQDGTTAFALVNSVNYTIRSDGGSSGSMQWEGGGASVYGNESTDTLEELDAIILGTSLE